MKTTLIIEIESKNIIYKGLETRVTAVRDISFKEKITKALEESENRYRTMVERSNDLIWTLDNEGKFCFMNAQFEL